MLAVAAIPSPEFPLSTQREPLTVRGTRAMETLDSEVPWWAIALLNLDTPELRNHRRVRSMFDQGQRAHEGSRIFWDLWADLLEMAERKVMSKSLDEWIDKAYEQTEATDPWNGGEITLAVRDAALRSTRAYGQFVGLVDDEGLAITFKDFHVKTVRAMRCSPYASILLPYEFGKSSLNNIVVPLMDYSEWRDASEGRIYWNDSHVTKWIRRLMGVIEHNERLHKIFPWVSRPQRGDPGWGIWGTRGFSLHGRTAFDKAFEPLTANQFSTGNRYSRVGGDDWENVANAPVVTIQDRLVDYWKTGPETMAQQLARTSKYGTAWPSRYLCGTLFSGQGVNNRIHLEYREFRRRGDVKYTAVRFDCFRDLAETATIWPEVKTLPYMLALRESLTPRIFNMRCRNIIDGRSHKVFPREAVLEAEYDGRNRAAFAWKVAPERALGVVIGFDPGSGKITKESKNPAYFVYCRRDGRPLLAPGLLRDPRLPNGANLPDPSLTPEIYHHGIEWGRMEGISFVPQCAKLIELAHYYRCPVAIEDNATQASYIDYIRQTAPDVRVFPHHTGPGGSDPRSGVEQFEPLFKNGRMVLHCAGAPVGSVLALREELTQWKGRYTDIVMAMWIARDQSESHFRDDKPALRLQTPMSAAQMRLRSYRR
jgi:hypothetical protein